MIPNELRGKKAVPFLELDTILLNELNKKLYDSKLGWKSSLNITEAGIYMSYIQEYLARKMQYNTFYSQPFSIEMLVNTEPPINQYPDMREVTMDMAIDAGDRSMAGQSFQFGNIEEPNPLWQQAEEKRIFEGWEKYPNGDMILKADNKIALSYDGHNKHLTNYYNEFGESQSWKVKSLNDFITLCNLSEINLTFKK